MVLPFLPGNVLWCVLDLLDDQERFSVARTSRHMYHQVGDYASKSGRWSSLTVHDPSHGRIGAFFSRITASCTHLHVRCPSPDDVEVLLARIAPFAGGLKSLVLDIVGHGSPGRMDRVPSSLGHAICMLEGLESLDIRLAAVDDECYLPLTSGLANLRCLVIEEAIPCDASPAAAFASYRGRPYVRNVHVSLGDQNGVAGELAHAKLVVRSCNILELMLSRRLGALKTLEYTPGARSDMYDNVLRLAAGLGNRAHDVIPHLERLELCVEGIDSIGFLEVMLMFDWVDDLVLHVSDSCSLYMHYLPAKNVHVLLYSMGVKQFRQDLTIDHHMFGTEEEYGRYRKGDLYRLRHMSIDAAPVRDPHLFKTSWAVRLLAPTTSNHASFVMSIMHVDTRKIPVIIDQPPTDGLHNNDFFM